MGKFKSLLSAFAGYKANWAVQCFSALSKKRHVRCKSTFQPLAHPKYPEITRSPELVRDFINDCLYNPASGYFTTNVNIFDTGAPINFTRLQDQEEYTRALYAMYSQSSSHDHKFYQLWHTPSELFKPWYGYGVAKCLVEEYLSYCKSVQSRSLPLIIYEVGPGNGTLAQSVLEYIQLYHPNLQLEYHLVEISELLLRNQKSRLLTKFPPSHHPNQIVSFHHSSILHWNHVETRPCFVIAMEVLDNLAHDRIRFADNGDLLEAQVLTNQNATFCSVPGKYWEVYEKAQDSLIIELVNCLDQIGYQFPSLQWSPRVILEHVPLLEYKSPWRSEFVPTGLYAFVKTIVTMFPQHRLLVSDFDWLPDCIPGWNAPVVQTRYKGDTINCSTYLLKRGLFDIFFPVNFDLLKQLHSFLSQTRHKTTTMLGQGKFVKLKHAEFCKQFVNVDQTRTISGFNPILNEFANVSCCLL